MNGNYVYQAAANYNVTSENLQDFLEEIGGYEDSIIENADLMATECGNIVNNLENSNDDLKSRWSDLKKNMEAYSTVIGKAKAKLQTEMESYIAETEQNEKEATEAAQEAVDDFSENADTFNSIEF